MPKKTEQNIIKKSVIEALEPFANSIQKDFQKMHKQLDIVDGRLDGVGGRFDAIDGRLDIMDGRLHVMNQRLTNVERDVQWMKENSSALFTKLDKFIALYEKNAQEILILSAHVRKLEERIAQLEAKQKLS